MILAGGCPQRCLVKAGSGNLKAALVLLVAAIASAMTLRGLLAVPRTDLLDRWGVALGRPQDLGSLFGGWLGEHFGLRSALAFAGGSALLLALAAWRVPAIRDVRALPQPEAERDWIGAEADVRAARPAVEPT